MHEATDRLSGAFDRLMLPDVQDVPACGDECLVVSQVPFDIPSKLRKPIVLSPARKPSVCRAEVPKTAVDEHDDSLSWEDDVRPHPDPPRDHRVVLPESEPFSVQVSAQTDFGLGIRTPVG